MLNNVKSLKNWQIQTSNEYNIVNRSLYYGSTLYRNSLEKGMAKGLEKEKIK